MVFEFSFLYKKDVLYSICVFRISDVSFDRVRDNVFVLSKTNFVLVSLEDQFLDFSGHSSWAGCQILIGLMHSERLIPALKRYDNAHEIAAVLFRILRWKRTCWSSINTTTHQRLSNIEIWNANGGRDEERNHLSLHLHSELHGFTDYWDLLI